MKQLKLIRALHGGAMGSVQKAKLIQEKGKDKSKEKDKSVKKVVLKSANKMDPNAKYIEQEIQALLKLANNPHPNIISIRYVIQDEEIVGFAEEYVSGVSMDQWIVYPMREGKIWALLKPLFSAIRHLHHHGIAHRDIKPQNIMLKIKGVIKRSMQPVVVDLGLAYNSENPESKYNHCGTKEFMPPECAKISRDADGTIIRNPSIDPVKSDVYSLGGTVVLMAVGLEFHIEFTTWDNYIKHIPVGFSPEFKTMVTSMLETDVSKRPTMDGLMDTYKEKLGLELVQ